MLETCGLSERVESIVTPRVVILSDKFTTEPAILMLEIAGKWCKRCCVPSKIASDLVGLRQSPFWQNQEWSRVRHDSRREIPGFGSAGESEM